MENYGSNSHKSKEQTERNVKKVVTGTVKTEKKSGLRKLTDVFVASDINSVLSYAFSEIFVPGIKKILCEVVENGARMIFLGEEGRANKQTTVTDWVSYRNYYGKDDDDRMHRTYSSNKFQFDNITFETRSDAEQVLSAMDDILEEYNSVRVADLYELVGVTGDYTDHNYGWYNLRSAEAVRYRGGWRLRLPRVTPLRK